MFNLDNEDNDSDNDVKADDDETATFMTSKSSKGTCSSKSGGGKGSNSEESDTASVDHFSEGKEEVFDAKTSKPDPAPKRKASKMFDENFLSRIYKGLPRDEYVEKDVAVSDQSADDNDNLEHWHFMHWLMVTGYIMRTFEFGTLITSNWIARNYAKKIMINPGIKVVVNGENKENWSWFMKCLIDDLGLVAGEGLTIISNQQKGIIKAVKEVMPLAEHRQCARHIYANFRKKFTGAQYRNLFWKAAKATYPAKFEQVMKEIKDISNDTHKHLMDRHPEIDARRKPIINMLEDIRVLLMERMQRMREKPVKWNDVLYPNIRKKFELLNDLHRHWKVIASGESRFEVRNGFEGFKVDERLRTCTCRAWQLSSIPCQHGLAAIYFLHRDLEEYVSNWYKKDMFVAAYNHYITGMNGIGQWPTTQYQKPLPPIKRRMPGRPPHKIKMDSSEGDGNRTIVSRIGQVIHRKTCGGEGHNKRGCHASPTQNTTPTLTPAENTTPTENTTSGGSASGDVRTMGGFVSGSMRTRRGSVRGGSARGGSVRGGSTRGRSVRGGSIRGGSVKGRSARGGSASFSTPTKEGSASFTTPTKDESAMIMTPAKVSQVGESVYGGFVFKTINGKTVRSRGRGDGSKSSAYPHGIRPIGFGVLHNVQGIPVPAWPYEGTPADLTRTTSDKGRNLVMRRKESERINQMHFNKPPLPGPGLTPDDAMVLE
ncbi:multidrug resistance-associated protein 5 [Tanacetum coccineum]